MCRDLSRFLSLIARHPLGSDGGFSSTVGGLKHGGSIMTVEQRLEQLEQRNKRLTVALTMTVVAMCAVVTMAATGEKDDHFDRLQPPDRENAP